MHSEQVTQATVFQLQPTLHCKIELVILLPRCCTMHDGVTDQMHEKSLCSTDFFFRIKIFMFPKIPRKIIEVENDVPYGAANLQLEIFCIPAYTKMTNF